MQGKNGEVLLRFHMKTEQCERGLSEMICRAKAKEQLRQCIDLMKTILVNDVNDLFRTFIAKRFP